MTVHELESADAVNAFKSSNSNTLICFSATWCGPCKASKPTYEALAQSYLADPATDLKCAIVYEHNLTEAIHEFQIKAFPTYVLFVNNGTTEHGKIQGADFDGIKGMIEEAGGCKMVHAEGNTLGGNDVVVVSAEEARALRLAMFDKKNKVSNDSVPVAKPVEDSSMEVDVQATAVEATSTDVEMKDDSAPQEIEMEDPTEKLSKEDITTLTDSMGFTLIRAQKGLIHSNSGVEGAIEWLMAHQDDAGIDDPIQKVPKAGTGAIAKSYKCVTSGKHFSSMSALEIHANKTGYSDFEESTVAITPLTAEEKAIKIAEIKELLKVKRAEREEVEKVEEVDREKQRREMGKTTAITREEMDKQARQRETRRMKKEKEDFKRERARIKAELEKDKMERIAHKGKLTSKLGIGGYNPDAIQYDVNPVETADPGPNPHKKIKASVAKIDEYITKVSSYKAGGDGGKCLKILLAYIGNAVDHPGDDKFKKINMENKIYKSKVKPFVGAKALLLAVGFQPNKTNDALFLADDAVLDVLKETKEKLESAHSAY